MPHGRGLDDIGISTRRLTNTRSTLRPTIFDPRWDAILAVTNTTATVCGKRETPLRGTVEPLSPCARVHLCGRELTDVGEGNAVSTSAQPLRKHEDEREDLSSPT